MNRSCSHMRYVIVDLEATCWMAQTDPQEMEIIEIGAVLLNTETGPVQKEFTSLVRPIRTPILSAFCMGLTGIQQHEIDGAGDFTKVFPEFLEWIGPQPYRLCSWSTFDLNQFKTDCSRHGLSLPGGFSNHLNLKLKFARLQGIHPCGPKRALSILQLPAEGRAHRALDDAQNITRIALKGVLPKLVG